MKKLFCLMFAVLITAFMFNGCATDTAYGISKTVYGGAKKLVKSNSEKLSPETLEKLKRIDKKAVTYDTGRTIVRDTVDNLKTKK